MKILYFEDLRDTESVVTNAVVLVLGVAITTYLRGDIYPPIKLNCNVLGIDNVMPLQIHRGRTDT